MDNMCLVGKEGDQRQLQEKDMLGEFQGDKLIKVDHAVGILKRSKAAKKVTYKDTCRKGRAQGKKDVVDATQGESLAQNFGNLILDDIGQGGSEVLVDMEEELRISKSFVELEEMESLNLGLLDVGFVGDKYTWTNNEIWKRLDRVLITSSWSNKEVVVKGMWTKHHNFLLVVRLNWMMPASGGGL
ncbi:hypothetical protein ZIOFF_001521 [Zingiber officinale]|uniref:DUF4283 domain-containing protein n=1 Tax=Zingiber officinale TaxID=94328 RepID=A0A8J5IK07_ZINOF|nr:hypothetical protein ZIOFF_001521 [Zingiber officinale]